MRRIASLLMMLALWPALARGESETARWRREAAAVTIVRDDWGIAHVRGHTDADAVFGMMYAQAEDDFNRVETNYLNALGRLAEAEGEGAVWSDLRQKLWVSPADLQARYAASPRWLRRLMDAWADGLNYYLATHPSVAPRVIRRFEPWMALSFTEGSIGGDIERAKLDALAAFYGGKALAQASEAPFPHTREPSGSNGIAIAPANTRDHHALLLINPHTSFYFRAEQQVASDEGLDAYGAATWGQFFIYQGFNAQAGWMHTSTGADAVDRFAETIIRRDGRLVYRYGDAWLPVTVSAVDVPYRIPGGGLASRTFTVYRTRHGPIVAAGVDGHWIALSLMFKPVEALSQSYLRTKADSLAAFLKMADFQANSSNNTLFADAAGDIAYLHPQFVPVRDDRFDYTRPVDGADPATDWKGVHTFDTLPRVLNPSSGYVFNTNDAPWAAAGADSPRAKDYPRYMDTAGENPRGVHAALLLGGRRDFTPESLMAAAYDPYMPAFARLIPTLVEAWDRTPAGDPLKARTADQIAVLRGWDDRWAAGSVATSLAVFWGETMWNRLAADPDGEGLTIYDRIATRETAAEKLSTLAEASDRLTVDFGSWRTPWGEINRFQRLDDAIKPHFDDARPSIPVPFASARWGSLASFGAKPGPGTRKWYGTSGNSFVAVVEFGDRVRAWAVTAGGESGDPASPHFDDQAARYASGALRPIWFYPQDLAGHTAKVYHPGGPGGL